MDPVDALAPRRGITCTAGTGGTETTVAALASRLGRAVVTATVRIPILDDRIDSVLVTGRWVSRVAARPSNEQA